MSETKAAGVSSGVWKAGLWDDGYSDPLANRIRLMLWERMPYGVPYGVPRRYLTRDGSWREWKEGDKVDEDAGILLPRDAIEAIAQAIQEWQGHTSHADTEARVLREWLRVEIDRVDEMLPTRREMPEHPAP